VNPTEPSVIAHTALKSFPLLVIPRWCATACTFRTPTFAISWAKIVFTEFAVASMRFIVPASSSAKLCTSQGPLRVAHCGSVMKSSGGP
jgi:hypothetical protein